MSIGWGITESGYIFRDYNIGDTVNGHQIINALKDVIREFGNTFWGSPINYIEVRIDPNQLRYNYMREMYANIPENITDEEFFDIGIQSSDKYYNLCVSVYQRNPSASPPDNVRECLFSPSHEFSSVIIRHGRMRGETYDGSLNELRSVEDFINIMLTKLRDKLKKSQSERLECEKRGEIRTLESHLDKGFIPPKITTAEGKKEESNEIFAILKRTH